MKPQPSVSQKGRAAVAELHKLLNEPGLLRAALVHVRRSCGRDYCRCMRSKKHWHDSCYVSQHYRGKPRMQHVPPALRAQVAQWIERYRRAKELLDVISDGYWQSLKKRKG
jgi:hypothetical protein